MLQFVFFFDMINLNKGRCKKMEMENNNKGIGTGTFYAVMGVATLVITIIGATFAYFSAATNSNENAINTSGATVTLGFSDVDDGIKQNLIPIDVNIENNGTQLFNKGGYTLNGTTYKYAGIGANDCRDANGNNICSVYQFTVTNNSATSAQTIYPTFTVNTNGFTNLKYAVFKGTAEDVKNSTIGWDVDGTEVTTVTITDAAASGSDGSFGQTATAADATRKHVIGKPGDLIIAAKAPATEDWDDENTEWDRLRQILDKGESMTYTIIVYLAETGGQQNSEQGAKFAATVSFNTSDGSTGVTGSLLVQN